MRERKKVILALVKIGFSFEAVMGMPEEEAEGYLNAYAEIIDPKPKKKSYLVRRKGESHG